jgi:phosphoserine aminotransferase
LKDAALGRSHRSALGKSKLGEAIARSKKLLGVPDNYLLGILPGSDTGAFEAAMWTLLGPRPVTALVWESFSGEWAKDIQKELKLKPTVLEAPYGKLPDLQSVDWKSDVVFVANGTTSGVKIPNWDWIPADREGLSMCDATSAVFAMPVDWSKVDVLTFSWQKCLGGEAAHGVLVLSPRAAARIAAYDPPWPLPKVFRLKKKGAVDKAIFDGDTINTPSMLCVEDYLDALTWAESIGLEGLFKRSLANLKVVSDTFKAMAEKERGDFIKAVAGQLSKEGAAHDVSAYRDAPAGFRLWCGPTIEPQDVRQALDALEKVYLQKMK